VKEGVKLYHEWRKTKHGKVQRAKAIRFGDDLIRDNTVKHEESASASLKRA